MFDQEQEIFAAIDSNIFKQQTEDSLKVIEQINDLDDYKSLKQVISNHKSAPHQTEKKQLYKIKTKKSTSEARVQSSDLNSLNESQ